MITKKVLLDKIIRQIWSSSSSSCFGIPRSQLPPTGLGLSLWWGLPVPTLSFLDPPLSGCSGWHWLLWFLWTIFVIFGRFFNQVIWIITFDSFFYHHKNIKNDQLVFQMIMSSCDTKTDLKTSIGLSFSETLQLFVNQFP